MDDKDIDRLERRIGHVERELATHGGQLVRNAEAIEYLRDSSDERLRYIREQFDDAKKRDESIIDTLRGKGENNKWLFNVILSIVFGLFVAINYAYVEPIVDTINAVERRLLDVEKNINRSITTDSPE
jgi:hypothetical protein